MWPFKKKEAPKPSMVQVRIAELKAFRGIGEKFNYLGVTIIVTGHSELEMQGYGFRLTPTLQGDYKNDKGEIKAISFNYQELPALKAENL